MWQRMMKSKYNPDKAGMIGTSTVRPVPTPAETFMSWGATAQVTAWSSRQLEPAFRYHDMADDTHASEICLS
jgi:hypothetical protein